MFFKKALKVLKYYWIAFTVFFILFIATISAYRANISSAREHKEELFEIRTEQVRSAIERRLKDYIQILKGTKGFFNASTFVSRNEWNNYYKDLELDKNYPGIRGFGFAEFVFNHDLKSHIKEIKKEGFSNYTVFPEGARSSYAPIIYLEPSDERNRRAIGYDMYSDPIRRQAMELAWKIDEPVLSKKVTLVQEDNKDLQPGFLLYLPVYKNGMEPSTIDARYKYLKGFVYNPFRAHDLMSAILRDNFKDIDIEIYDGNYRDSSKLLYNSYPSITYDSTDTEALHLNKRLKIAHNAWTIYYTTLPKFDSGPEKQFSYLLLAGGLIISFLVSFVLFFFSNNRRVQAELLRKSEKIRFLTEAMPQKVWRTDEEGNANYFNKQWLQYTGLSFDELKNWGWEKVIHPEDLDESKKIKESLLSGNAFQVEHRLKRVDGEYRWHLSRGIPQKHKDEVITWVVTSTDIHDQKRYSVQLKRTNSNLDNFIHAASHDLKAPVSNIKALVSELKDENLKEAERAPIIEMIDDSIVRFQSTLKNLAEISKAQKQTTEDATEVDLSELIDNVKSDIRLLIEENNAIIREDIDKCPRIKFSNTNLRSIIYNLVTNAIKYRQLDRIPEVWITCYKTPDYFVLEVKDNGLGLKPEQKEKIFEMFKRVHSHVEGTGVGLYLVKRIVENEGGKIEVESEEGKGSTFKVFINRIEEA